MDKSFAEEKKTKQLKNDNTSRANGREGISSRDELPSSQKRTHALFLSLPLSGRDSPLLKQRKRNEGQSIIIQ